MTAAQEQCVDAVCGVQGWEQYFFVNRRTMHAMCCQAPAVFELLPDPTRTDVWPLDRHPPRCYVFRRDRTDAGAAENGEEVETEGADIGGEAVHVQLKDSLSEHGRVVRKDSYELADFRQVLQGALSDFEVRPRAAGSRCSLCLGGFLRYAGGHCWYAEAPVVAPSVWAVSHICASIRSGVAVYHLGALERE